MNGYKSNGFNQAWNGEQDEKNGQKPSSGAMDQITESGSVITNDGKHTIHCLTIIGQVEGHSYFAQPE